MKKHGFTLIELLVVIAIIGVVSTFSVSYFLQSQTKARDNQRKADLKTIASALERYYSENKQYPPCGNGCVSQTGGLPVTQPWIPGLTSAYTGNSTDFVPVNPVTGLSQYYYYLSATNSKKYIIWTTLENTNDPEIYTNTTAQCHYPSDQAPGYPTIPDTYVNFCVSSPTPCKYSSSGWGCH